MMTRHLLLPTVLAGGLLLAGVQPASADPLPAPHGPVLSRWQAAPLVSTSDPDELIIGGDGVVWYSEDTRVGPAGIVAFDPATGLSRSFSDSRVGTPDSLVEAADGSIWFSQAFTATVRRLDPVTGALQDIAVPFPARPQSMAAARDGSVWFGTDQPGMIGHVVPGDTTAAIVDIGGARTGEPHEVIEGPDGRLWVVNDASDQIDAYDPVVGTTTTYGLPSIGARDLIVGPDGHLWLNGLTSMIRLSVGGGVDVFDLPRTSRTVIQDVAANHRGVYIATEREIYAVAPDGSFALIRPDSHLFQIESLDAGPDGYLWYQDTRVLTPLMFG